MARIFNFSGSGGGTRTSVALNELSSGARGRKPDAARNSAAANSHSAGSGKRASESERAAAVQIMERGAVPKTQEANREWTPLAGKQERRHRRRVKISAPVRVRQIHVEHAAEFDMTMTSDVSREGILFETSRTSYMRGQEVAVVFPYRPAPGEMVREQRGQVVRVVRASESRYGVAVAFVDGPPTHELTDSAGNLMRDSASIDEELILQPRAKAGSKPLILVVDADEEMRMLLRSEIGLHGYAVEAVQDPSMAVALLRHRAPVALICEAEPFPGVMPGGGEMSGYDLCVIVRRNPKFGHMPVILTTRTGLPSDFATAHALGATVCVAKPYDLARIANLLRMLVPME